MNRSSTKVLLLTFLLVLMCILLTACYVPTDEISNTGLTDSGNSGTIQFQTIPPAGTPTPTIAPVTATPVSTNWAGWDTTVTPNTNPFAASTTPMFTLPVVTLNPTATPAPTATAASLKKGSSGSDVKAVQRRLKNLGYYNGEIDGDYGDATVAAVRAFQKANGLAVDGKVGSKTLAKLNSSTAVATRKATATPKKTTAKTTPKKTATPTPRRTATPTPRKTATPRPTATPKINTYVENGDTGSAVRKLQDRLISLGYLAGKADGKYGPGTELAIRAFQKQAGIWVAGIAGPTTLSRLYASNAPKADSAAASIGIKLKSGAEGQAVRALQKRLKALGYYSGAVDGSYGRETENAVMAFQLSRGLKADGVAGTDTLAALYATSSTAAPRTATPAPTTQISSTGYITLRRDSYGDSVRNLQTKLKSLGFYSGAVDGKYGEGTETAVRNFQKAKNLRVDGVAGPATQRALYSTTSGTTRYSTIRKGDTGNAVSNLQYTLYELGYYDGSVDGIYGDTTADAVRAFQIRNKITPVDGVAGSKTLSVLYSSSAIPDLEPTSTFTTLSLGSNGEAVLELKDTLIQLGYLTGSVNAEYDTATQAAVSLFQAKNGLPITGVADSATQTKLFSSSAIHN